MLVEWKFVFLVQTWFLNSERFIEWFTQQLLPNIPPISVIVLDNALYHNKQTFQNFSNDYFDQRPFVLLTRILLSLATT